MKPGRRWSNSPRGQLLVIGLLLAVATLPTIGACTTGPQGLSRVLNALGGAGLPEHAARELARFERVYDRYSLDRKDRDQLEYFGFAFKRLRAGYVREVSDAALIDAAIKGVEDKKPQPHAVPSALLVENALDAMTASLDPHTAFLNPEEFKESFVQTKGEFGGLGIEVTMGEDGFVKVVAPIEDTSAARAGIKAGDRITHVDGDAVKGKTLHQAVRQMRGMPGTPINLMIKREGRGDFHLTIVRAVIKVRSVKWRRKGRIGYIQVTRFSERTEGGIVKAIASLNADSAGPPTGIVLDLRNNPGGLLDQSVILADAFLDDGVVVSVRGRGPRQVRTRDAGEGDLADGLPMVVLVNRGSASASEIVAAALKYHKRAVLMGVRSFGKGSVQTIVPLPVEGALKMTTALYYGPDGRTIQARGVEPDIIVEPEEASDRRREADLPGAIPAAGREVSESHPRISEKACPAIGEKKDRLLGCALSYLRAGSTEKFMAAHGQVQM